MSFEKGELELAINKYHTAFWDFFFSNITYLGDGVFIVFLVIVLFFWKVYYGILGVATFSVSAVVSQSMKRLIFDDWPRPSKFFQDLTDIHYIEGLDIHSWFSFPSGHTSGAFTAFCLLALLTKNKYVEVSMFILALLVGVSRVYLMQHFFMDIYAGAIIGIFVTVVIYHLIHHKTNLPEKPNLQRPFFDLLRKKNS